MSLPGVETSAWAERAADRSPLVHRSRARSIEQAKAMVDAARRLVAQKGERFTTQELVKEAGVALQTFYRHFEGPRFITAEHWRLHQLYPEEMAYATKPVTDLFLREIRAAEARGLLHPADPERAAWLMTKLIMGAFHHYAFATTDQGAATVADDVWAFCLRGLNGGSTRRARQPKPRKGTAP
jgi:AcrR family transcriptional regulator